MAIFRLMQAGLVGMGWQLAIIALVQFATELPGSAISCNGAIIECWGLADNASGSPVVRPFVGWIYFFSAIGVSLTRTRFIDNTAAEIGRASRALYPAEPHQAARFLLAQLAIAAIGCLILALRLPPDALVELSQRLVGTPALATAVWSGGLSVLAAGFGANAHATARTANSGT